MQWSLDLCVYNWYLIAMNRAGEGRFTPYYSFITVTSVIEGQHIAELELPWPQKTLLPRGKESKFTFDPSTFAYSFAVDKIRKLRLVIGLNFEGKAIKGPQYYLFKHTLQLTCERLERIRL